MVIVVVLLTFAGKPDQSGMHLFAVEPQDFPSAHGRTSSRSWGINLTYGSAITYPFFFAFMFSLLRRTGPIRSYDASALTSLKETFGAASRRVGPLPVRGRSAVAGYITPFALTTHLPNLDTLFPRGWRPRQIRRPTARTTSGRSYAVYDTLRYNLDTIGQLLGAGIAIAMSFAWRRLPAGRMLFAFSRDDGVPGSGWLKKVSAPDTIERPEGSRSSSWRSCSRSPPSTSGRSAARAAVGLPS